jgi:Mg2+/Co2+ transporter CorB
LDQLSLPLLFGLLTGCLALSAFFSGTETALMSINRYQLRTLAQQGERRAQLAERLLAQPDRLIGLILLGNNLVNNLAATLVAVIVLKVSSDEWLAVGAGLLTFVMLVFCEVGPKTVGALNPRPLALNSAPIYRVLELALYPLVWIINRVTNGALRVVGVRVDRATQQTALTQDELRTVVAEAGALIPQRHHRMLMSILDLEQVTVDDIMIHRQDVAGIDLDEDWPAIVEQLKSTPYTRMPVYRGELDNIVGLLHMKRVVQELAAGTLDAERLAAIAQAREPYFVPAGTPLSVQLMNFQRHRRRFAFVVDEYGDIQGLVTLEALLEEIVGEFTSDPQAIGHKAIHPEPDGSFRIDAGTTIRAINRALGWQLPTDGATTLNGLILDELGTIPKAGTTLTVGDIELTATEIGETRIEAVRARVLPAPTAS